MRLRKRLIALAVVAVALGNAGCVMLAATAVGGGAVGLAYANGKITNTVDASIDATAIATHSALLDLGLPVEGQDVGRAHGELESRTPAGKQIQIDLDAVVPEVPADPPKTKVAIRVLPFGDEAVSRRVFEQIEFRLRSPATAGPAPSSSAPPPPLPPLPTKQTEEPPIAKP